VPTGSALAAFHAKAESGPAIDHDGTMGVILGNWKRTSHKRTPTSTGCSRVRPPTDQPPCAGVHRAGGIVDRRIAAGRIRDGHGDLRAEHICVTDPVVIFDCIEFNHRFDTATWPGRSVLAMDLRNVASRSGADLRHAWGVCAGTLNCRACWTL
jgi:aminoglycoside phosphotransferase family enzyme